MIYFTSKSKVTLNTKNNIIIRCNKTLFRFDIIYVYYFLFNVFLHNDNDIIQLTNFYEKKKLISHVCVFFLCWIEDV